MMSEASTRSSSPMSSPRSPKSYRRQLNGEAAMNTIRITALVCASILTFFAYLVCRHNIPSKTLETLIESPSTVYRSLSHDNAFHSTESPPLSSDASHNSSDNNDPPSLTQTYIVSHQTLEFDSISARPVPVSSAASSSANQLGLFLRHETFTHLAREQPLVEPRRVRIGVFQTAPHSVNEQLSGPQNMNELYTNMEEKLRLAKSFGVNIVVLEELWTVPMTTLLQSTSSQPLDESSKMKYQFEDFAEDSETGPTAQFIKSKAAELEIVIVSPILERIPGPMGDVLSSVLIVDSDGSLLTVQRSNHAALCHGDVHQSTLPHHNVVETQYGKLGVNLGSGRLHPLNWVGFGLNNADIVLAPSASSNPIVKSGWMRDALTFASSYEMFIISSNRIQSPQGGPQFFGSSFVACPNGSRGALMSSDTAGVLIVDLDLNTVTQTRDSSKRQQHARYSSYGPVLSKYLS